MTNVEGCSQPPGFQTSTASFILFMPTQERFPNMSRLPI